MINVDVEVSKHKNVKDRGQLSLIINEYKKLAIQNAGNFSEASKINSIIMKLQEQADKCPTPQLKKIPVGHSVQTKTAKISSNEKSRIEKEWNKKTHK